MKIRYLVPVIFAALPVQKSFAHHSNAASFTDTPLIVEGYVEEYIFKNPHVIVYLKVKDPKTGEPVKWMSEGPAATGYRLAGWDKTTFKPGDYIRISGYAGKNNRPMIQMHDVSFVDPQTGAVLYDVNSARNKLEPDDSNSEDFTYPEKLPDGRPNLHGMWVLGGDGPIPSFLGNADPIFTPEGQAIQDKVRAIDDPQYVQCEPAILIRQVGFTPHPVRITQLEDRIIFQYEEYAGERVVYLDDREYGNFDENKRYRQGRYKAYYKDDELIIESDLLQGGWTSVLGQSTSENATTVETYTRQFDPKWGPTVHLSMIITDAERLAEPWEMKWNKYYTLKGFTGTKRDNIQKDYQMLPVECKIPLTAGYDLKGPPTDEVRNPGTRTITPVTNTRPAELGQNTVTEESGGTKLWLYVLGLLAALLAIGGLLRGRQKKQ